MSNQKVSKKSIFTLAHLLHKGEVFKTFSECLKEAWKQAKQAALQVIQITKKSGEVSKRVVSTEWAKFQAPTGKGKPMPKGLTLFADLFKVATGKKNVIISSYNFQTL